MLADANSDVKNKNVGRGARVCRYDAVCRRRRSPLPPKAARSAPYARAESRVIIVRRRRLQRRRRQRDGGDLCRVHFAAR